MFFSKFILFPKRLPQHLKTQRSSMDVFDSMGQFVDGLKFSGGSQSLMPESYIKKVTDMAHSHNVIPALVIGVSTCSERSICSEHYIEECKRLGFDTIELDAGSLEIPEETLLRYVYMIKGAGLKVKPQFAVKFDKSDIPLSGDRAFGAYVVPRPGLMVFENSYFVEDVDLLIRKAERCLEAGADMIMIDAENVCRRAESLRSDIIAKIIGRLGVEKTMFDAADARTADWFISQYGPKVNLFVDHSLVIDLECLRGRKVGKNHMSVLSSAYRLL
ncbi:Protein HEAT-STRESS-ASSOCIATED 32 [Bienertia sinuspersici]